MQAFHTNWTRPFFAKHMGEYYIEDFELLTTILSALKWREKNGDIKMVTDSIGAKYYRDLGMESIWNLGIDDTLEDDMNPNIDSNTFWAAGKIFALNKQVGPCVMIDTDFIVWTDIRNILEQDELAVIHKEDLIEDVYPDKSRFKVNSSYKYSEAWDWTEKACNTAFAFFKDDDFRKYYSDKSIDFMNNVTGEDPLIYMVFAEQRLLSMCAKEKKINVHALSDLDSLFNSNQQSFTHIWGHKRYIRSNPIVREAFCKKCINRIKKDFKEYYDIVRNIECLKQYCEDDIEVNII